MGSTPLLCLSTTSLRLSLVLCRCELCSILDALLSFSITEIILNHTKGALSRSCLLFALSFAYATFTSLYNLPFLRRTKFTANLFQLLWLPLYHRRRLYYSIFPSLTICSLRHQFERWMVSNVANDSRRSVFIFLRRMLWNVWRMNESGERIWSMTEIIERDLSSLLYSFFPPPILNFFFFFFFFFLLLFFFFFFFFFFLLLLLLLPTPYAHNSLYISLSLNIYMKASYYPMRMWSRD